MSAATLATARAYYCSLFASRPVRAPRAHVLTLHPGHVAAYCQPFQAFRQSITGWVATYTRGV